MIQYAFYGYIIIIGQIYLHASDYKPMGLLVLVLPYTL